MILGFILAVSGSLIGISYLIGLYLDVLSEMQRLAGFFLGLFLFLVVAGVAGYYYIDRRLAVLTLRNKQLKRQLNTLNKIPHTHCTDCGCRVYVEGNGAEDDIT